MNKYLYNITSIPEAHKDLFISLNEAIIEAFKRESLAKRHLVRTPTGSYLIVLNSELVELRRWDSEENNPCDGWWIAAEYNGRWFTDTEPTLKDLKRSLGL